MKLSEVSKTAIITLRSHVIESEKPNPIIKDPVSRFCLDKLVSLATAGEKALFERKLPMGASNHIALRARKYDSAINDFISKNPSSTVVNLGCGFDTRYWRIENKKCRYIELDLPEVVELKREILGERLSYELIGCSVLDTSWIDRVVSEGNENFLLVAEGLFMYLPKMEVVKLFGEFSGRFLHSQVVFEVVSERYTSGILKKLVDFKFKREFGVDAGSSYSFGVKDAREVESYGRGIKVVDEWFYGTDADVRPWILGYLGRLGFSRLQWTVTATVNAT
jgi:O-methyltransferase involved in polyketide biosynthesis